LAWFEAGGGGSAAEETLGFWIVFGALLFAVVAIVDCWGG